MIIKQAPEKPGSPPSSRGRRALRWTAVVSLVVVAAGTGILLLGTSPQSSRWFLDQGFVVRSDSGVPTALVRMTTRWLATRMDHVEAPALNLDIKFRHMQTLESQRAEALRRGILVQGEDDYVPATVRLDDRTVKVRLRLKGDWVDHLIGDTWSVRVHVRGDDHIFGLRRFSIQHPRVRDFHFEPLFFEALRHEGVLTPRYFFADVVRNGDRLGRMAIEEHFSKELLESQGRVESVILKFDESEIWSSPDGYLRGFYGAFDNPAIATIEPFRAARVAKSELLSEHLRTATGLLRGFVNGHLPASRVFDVELLGRFVAVAETWGTRHALRWHNQRYYYNPLTARLEPIGFDGNVGRHAVTASVVVNRRDPLVVAMLSDPAVARVYAETLTTWARELEGGELLDRLRSVEVEQRRTLNRHYLLLEPFDFDGLRRRAERLVRALEGEAGPWYPDYPEIVRAYTLEDGGTDYLEIVNAVPHPIEVTSIRWTDANGGFHAPFSRAGLPLAIAATRKGAVPEAVRMPFRRTKAADDARLEIEARIRGQGRVYRTGATPYFASLHETPIREPTRRELIARHAFLRWNAEKNELQIPTGRWRIGDALVIPRGLGLDVSPGTTLLFAENGSLISQGPTRMRGTPDHPIVLEGGGGDGTWQGFAAIRAGAPSHWSYVTVRNTTGIDRERWKLSSGVTFYESDVHLAHCRFLSNRTEDALNIVRSTFVIEQVEMLDTQSDALDADFSKGSIEGGSFENIGTLSGGDAIDVSGGEVRIHDVRFRHVMDKAISVGEASNVEAAKVVIEQAGVGAASKDGSTLTITDSLVRAPRLAALMAYVKKPEYGPGTLTAEKIAFESAPTAARVQTGSSLSIDGRPVEAEDIDVEALYAGPMKRGARQ